MSKKSKVKNKSFKKADYEKFSKDFKNTLGTALAAAFGFLMAFTWRDVIAIYIDKIALKSPLKGQLMATIILTIISVLAIMIISRYLIDKKEES
ncbi:MAG: DUF5654 family protein [Nanoarchaeota archaeon]